MATKKQMAARKKLTLQVRAKGATKVGGAQEQRHARAQAREVARVARKYPECSRIELVP
jgi:hypothetical protein